MKKHTNDKGQEWYTEAEEETAFSADLFHVVPNDYDSNVQVALHTNLGSLTVMDRMTGFWGGIRDTETGYRDPDGAFWLASGMIDVRNSPAKTIGEAIQWVKDRANNCIGYKTA